MATRTASPAWNLATLRELVIKTVANYGEDNVPRLAAAFSFYAILSLAPLLVLAVVGAGYFYGHAVDAKQALLTQAKDAVGPQGAELLSNMLDSARKPGAGAIATIVSLTITFFSASNLFLQLNDAVNTIWGIRQKGSFVRTLILTRVVAFLSVMVFGLIVLAWLGVDSWLGWLERHTEGFHGWQVVSFVVAVVLLTGGFLLSFKTLPKHRVHWGDALPGAVVTGVGIAIAKLLLSLYFANFNVSAAYGSAGALVVILLWINYTSLIYFFGVELTYTYAHEFGSLKGVPPDGLQRS